MVDTHQPGTRTGPQVGVVLVHRTLPPKMPPHPTAQGRGHATLLVLYAALLVSAPAAAQSRAPIRTTGPGYDGAIVDRDSQRGQGNSVKAAAAWTPTEEDVRKAERVLPAFLASSEAVSK